MHFETDIFTQFHEKWALLSAGTPEDFNAMTISWGSMGTLWGKPMVTVYVKPIRHTWRYLEANDFFTVSFYPPSFRDDLMLMGTRSGRDGDKVALTALRPVPLEESVTFGQAEVTLLCRKRYCQALTREGMPPEVVSAFYAEEEPHRMVIGEVIRICPPEGRA